MKKFSSKTESTASNLEPPQNGACSKKPPANESIDLSGVLTKEGQVLDFPEFREYVIEIADFCGTKSRAANALKINSGFFTQVIEYKQDSPTLRRVLKVRKTNRRRFCCEDPDGTITAMVDAAAQGRGMTRGELLTWLLEECE